MMHLVYSTNDKNRNTKTNDTKNTFYFLSFQGSYTSFQVALFNNDICIKQESLQGKASAQLIPYLDKLLQDAHLKLSDISFIALDQGPGAFTSLRVTITTANALSFAKNIPLIGIDGLDALAYEIANNNNQEGHILVLLNAFNNEIYFGLYRNENNVLHIIEKTYDNYEIVFTKIARSSDITKIICVGNGLELYKNSLQTICASKHIHTVDQPSIASAQQIGLMAYERWKKKENIQNYLLPLYLKTQKFKPKYS